jgi:hypothetical protein
MKKNRKNRLGLTAAAHRAISKVTREFDTWAQMSWTMMN